jgi:hypothetical protein
MRVVHLGLVISAVMFALGQPVLAADEEVCTVGGKVVYNGKPLPDGTITFHPAKGKPVAGKVKDGFFVVESVPAGTVTVTFESKTVALPEKHGSPKTTDLQVDVKKGKNAVNFMLSG